MLQKSCKSHPFLEPYTKRKNHKQSGQQDITLLSRKIYKTGYNFISRCEVAVFSVKSTTTASKNLG